MEALVMITAMENNGSIGCDHSNLYVMVALAMIIAMESNGSIGGDHKNVKQSGFQSKYKCYIILNNFI